MAKHTPGATKHPKIIEVAMQRLHRAGLKPKLENVKVVDSQPADPTVGIFSGYEVVNYQIQLQAQKELSVFENNDGPASKIAHTDFYSGRRANSFMGMLSALSVQPDVSVFIEAKGSKIVLHIQVVKEIQHLRAEKDLERGREAMQEMETDNEED